jgi:hypothetical protein
MALLEIDSLTPGMKVGKDVVEASGQVLLRAGTEISEKHLRVLRSWGIQQVDIEGPKPPDTEDTLLSRASPELLDRAQASVGERFHHTDPAHPAITELMRLAVVAELRSLLPPPPAV